MLLGFGMDATALSIAAQPTRSGIALRRRAPFIRGCRFVDLLVIKARRPIANNTCVDSAIRNP
jgi:hypothetical protein